MKDNNSRKIGVHFGFLCEPLHKQLGITEEILREEQEMADSICTLGLNDILTDGEVDKARKRLIKRIAKTIGGK